MFGLPEALMSFIRRQVGLRTDTANASGSLHAKIADLKGVTNDNIFSWHKKVVTLSKGGINSLPVNTTQEILRINGNRVILGGQIVGSDTLQDYMRLTLEIDGVDIFTTPLDYLANMEFYTDPYKRAGAYWNGTSVKNNWIIPLPKGLHFSSSLVVTLQHLSTGTSDTDVGVAIWHVPA